MIRLFHEPSVLPVLNHQNRNYETAPMLVFLWEVNLFLMYKYAFVPINLHSCWPCRTYNAKHYAFLGNFPPTPPLSQR